MSAPTKRRHALYYLSFPLVIAIVFFMVAQLAAWQRAELIAELADRVAHQETREARAALRQLAAMPRPPLKVLVAATTSADHEVAREAQRLITGQLRRWKRQIDEGSGTRAVARRLNELASLLARDRSNFDDGDYRWLAKVSRRILKLSNRLPSGHAPLVAANCDSILAMIASREASALALAERDTAHRQRTITPVTAAAEILDEPQSSPALLQREIPGTAADSFVTTDEAIDQALVGAESRPAATQSSPMHPELADRHNAGPQEEFVEGDDMSPGDDAAGDLRPESPWLGASSLPWRAEWSHPLLRTLPAMPVKTFPVSSGRPSHSPPSDFLPVPANSERGRRQLMKEDSRELLQRWLTASGSEAIALEEELAHRGFGRLSARLVQQLVAGDADERLQLVDNVLVEPGVDARPWLIMLAADPDADVRLLAVTIMATSDDPMLLEKAWEAAIHDRDPRIADLAGRLRPRHGNVRRR